MGGRGALGHREIRRSPVEVGSLSHYSQGFFCQKSTLPPIIMVQWKMGVSPILVSESFRDFRVIL